MKLFPSISSPILENINLRDFTTWKIGGPAEFYCEPHLEEIPQILSLAHERDIRATFLGRGSNVLISDAGIRGLVLHTRNSMCSIIRSQTGEIIADGGVSLPRLSRFAANLGYTGYEFLIGIPGTVGGGVAMNAGTTAFRPREISDVLSKLEIVTLDGRRSIIDAKNAGLAYRDSRILKENLFVLRAWFKQTEMTKPEEIRLRTAEHLAERKRKQPLNQPTAGSTFKNPPGSKSAGWYIENVGLKGYRIGGAVVSNKHANWIENRYCASSADIRNLIDHIKSVVEDRFAQILIPEVRFF